MLIVSDPDSLYQMLTEESEQIKDLEKQKEQVKAANAESSKQYEDVKNTKSQFEQTFEQFFEQRVYLFNITNQFDDE